MDEKLSAAQLLGGLKAAGESTRLRLLALFADGELNVKDLTRILGQSQPRISRHLKLLAEAGLIERFREGSWVYFRLGDGNGPASLARSIVEALDRSDSVLAQDRARAEGVKRERAEAAQDYFRDHAGEWDAIRALHVAERQVEAAMLEALGPGPFDVLADLGTGTGRILELFADRFIRGVGVDINRGMLAYARAKLEAGGLGHCQVRYGDLLSLAMSDNAADAVVLHQVLHFLDDPAGVLREAARILKPGGKLLVVDFAPHELEYLRDDFAHRRLGIDPRQMQRWFDALGLHLESRKSLEPAGEEASDKLTVLLWLARKTKGNRGAPSRTGADSLEVVE